MRRVIEALRLRFDQRLSQRDIARSLGLSQGSVNAYLTRFTASGLSWPLPEDLGESELEARLFIGPPTPTNGDATAARLGHGAAGAEAEGRHAPTALARVQDAAPRRLSVHAVLRALPHVGRDAGAGAAPSARRRRTRVRRLRRPDDARRRCHDRRGARGPNLRRRARGESSHLRRSDVDADARRTGSARTCACSSIFGGVTRAHRARQRRARSSGTRATTSPSSTRRYQDFATHYATAILPTRGRESARQGESRDGRPDRRAGDHGPASP